MLRDSGLYCPNTSSAARAVLAKTNEPLDHPLAFSMATTEDSGIRISRPTRNDGIVPMETSFRIVVALQPHRRATSSGVRIVLFIHHSRSELTEHGSGATTMVATRIFSEEDRAASECVIEIKQLFEIRSPSQKKNYNYLILLKTNFTSGERKKSVVRANPGSCRYFKGAFQKVRHVAEPRRHGRVVQPFSPRRSAAIRSASSRFWIAASRAARSRRRLRRPMAARP